MGLQHGPNTINDELVFCIDAANPKSYTSGDSNVLNIKDTTITGSIEGSLSFSSNNAGVWGFDGDGDYIDCGSIPSSNILSLYNTPFTLSTWIAANLTGDNYQRIIDKGIATQGDEGYALSIHTSPSPATLYFYLDVTTIFSYTIPVYSAGQWINIAITKNGNDHVLYLDGEVAASNTVAQNASGTTANTRIGSSPAVSSRDFNGKISNLSIYNKALTAQEVKQNYNALKGRFGL